MSLFSRALRLTATNVTRAWKTPNYVTSYSFSASTIPSPPKVQGMAPNFEGTAVVDEDFKQIKLSDFKGKYLVFYFYPLDFTFVCPTEIIAFSEMYDEFKKIDTEIVACSTDSHFSHLAWKNTSRKAGGIGQIRYPLLSDFTKTIAKDYGVLIEKSGIALRGLFIIDGKGVIRHMSVNDLPVGRSVEEILRLVKAFQFNDKHGEGIKVSGKTEKALCTESSIISKQSKTGPGAPGETDKALSKDSITSKQSKTNPETPGETEKVLSKDSITSKQSKTNPETSGETEKVLSKDSITSKLSKTNPETRGETEKVLSKDSITSKQSKTNLETPGETEKVLSKDSIISKQFKTDPGIPGESAVSKDSTITSNISETNAGIAPPSKKSLKEKLKEVISRPNPKTVEKK